MTIPELEPFLQLVDPLKNNDSTRIVYDFLHRELREVFSPTTAQHLCSKVIAMCHPRALIGEALSTPEWRDFVHELEDVANRCGAAIYERYQ
jgi:hypothetical protein